MTVFRVSSPASSANLGPGFDILSLALELRQTVKGTVTEDGIVSLGSGWTDELRDPVENLVAYSYSTTARELSGGTLPGMQLDAETDIPSARGLGSSAAAIAIGVALAHAVVGQPADPRALWKRVTQFEGHGDNAAATIFGGLQLVIPEAAPENIPYVGEMEAVLFIPDTQGKTRTARGVLQETWSRDDVIFNAARIGLFVKVCMLGEYTMLRTAMEDRWHQSARTVLYPYLPHMIDAAYVAGALGAALSGAGPTVVALTMGSSAQVMEAMEQCASAQLVAGKMQICQVTHTGTKVEQLS